MFKNNKNWTRGFKRRHNLLTSRSDGIERNSNVIHSKVSQRRRYIVVSTRHKRQCSYDIADVIQCIAILVHFPNLCHHGLDNTRHISVLQREISTLLIHSESRTKAYNCNLQSSYKELITTTEMRGEEYLVDAIDDVRSVCQTTTAVVLQEVAEAEQLLHHVTVGPATAPHNLFL